MRDSLKMIQEIVQLFKEQKLQITENQNFRNTYLRNIQLVQLINQADKQQEIIKGQTKFNDRERILLKIEQNEFFYINSQRRCFQIEKNNQQGFRIQKQAQQLSLNFYTINISQFFKNTIIIPIQVLKSKRQEKLVKFQKNNGDPVRF
ncbi:unnamed protein product [Paramecium sonneborni]|uniref:Uncharacterized protein n=1 Tax=Paramecium sonneborni TaxID=65129 RepID=A0A8S1NCB2_9CILI|nr:unnamed protein product [Paramecium sonneborni]